MGDEVVLRFFDRSSFAERVEVRTEQVVVERVRMVPVKLSPLVECQVREILVIGVHVDERDRGRSEKVRYVASDGRLSGPGAAGYPNDEWFQHRDPKLRGRRAERIMPRG